MISIISALAKNRAIGKKNDLPWHLPADLKHFKETTTGKTIVMGLNTFKSIGSRPLPNRKNIVLSSDSESKVPEGVVLVNSLESVLEMTKDEKEVMICGGAMVYQQFLPLADRLYLTYIDHDFEGDIFFPEFDMQSWQEVSREDHQPDEKNLYPYSFVILERKK
jgi:dihydrofolate reductase